MPVTVSNSLRWRLHLVFFFSKNILAHTQTHIIKSVHCSVRWEAGNWRYDKKNIKFFCHQLMKYLKLLESWRVKSTFHHVHIIYSVLKSDSTPLTPHPSLLSNNSADEGVNISLTSLQPPRTLQRSSVAACWSSRRQQLTYNMSRGQDKGWAVGVMQQFGPEIEQSWTYDTCDYCFFHTPWDHSTHLTHPPSPSLHVRIDVPVVITEETGWGQLWAPRLALLLVYLHTSFANCFSSVPFCRAFITIY